MSQKAPFSVAWWSPLPPQKSGISDYSFDVLSELAARLEVVSVVRDDVVDLVRAPKGVSVVGASAYLASAQRRCEVDIYQMGNHFGFMDTCTMPPSPRRECSSCTT